PQADMTPEAQRCIGEILARLEEPPPPCRCKRCLAGSEYGALAILTEVHEPPELVVGEIVSLGLGREVDDHAKRLPPRPRSIGISPMQVHVVQEWAIRRLPGP